MQNTIIIFIHLMAAAVAVGSSVYALFLVLPRIDRTENQTDLDENSTSYRMMEVLVPTVFVSLLFLVGSGVYYLMENYTEQVNLKEGYYNVLGIKLVFVALSFLLSVYVTFALRPRISHLDLRPENRKQVRPTLETMRLLSQVILWTVAMALFLGEYLSRY